MTGRNLKTRAGLPLMIAFFTLGLHVHAYWIVAACWAFMFVAGEAAHFLAEGRAVQGARKKPLPEAEPVPDDLSKYTPAGQAELSKELLRTLKQEVREADALPGRRCNWQMSEAWYEEALKATGSTAAEIGRLYQRFPVIRGAGYGIPKLVPAPPPAAVKRLDDAVRAERSRNAVPMSVAPPVSGAPGAAGVLPADQALAAALLEKHAQLWTAMQHVLNARQPQDASYLAARLTGFAALEAELAAVDKRLKELYARYDAVKSLNQVSEQILRTYGVPDGSHRCNGKYYQNIRYCPQHGKWLLP